jgi:hypothetical protein
MKVSDPAEVIHARVVEQALRRDAAAMKLEHPQLNCVCARMTQAAETIGALCDLLVRTRM